MIGTPPYQRYSTPIARRKRGRPSFGTVSAICRRGNDLYLFAAGTNTLVAYKYDPITKEWDLVAQVDPRTDPVNSCVTGLTVDREARSAPDVLGAVALTQVPCSAWSSVSIAAPTNIILFRFTR